MSSSLKVSSAVKVAALSVSLIGLSLQSGAAALKLSLKTSANSNSTAFDAPKIAAHTIPDKSERRGFSLRLPGSTRSRISFAKNEKPSTITLKKMMRRGKGGVDKVERQEAVTPTTTSSSPTNSVNGDEPKDEDRRSHGDRVAALIEAQTQTLRVDTDGEGPYIHMETAAPYAIPLTSSTELLKDRKRRLQIVDTATSVLREYLLSDEYDSGVNSEQCSKVRSVLNCAQSKDHTENLPEGYANDNDNGISRSYAGISAANHILLKALVEAGISEIADFAEVITSGGFLSESNRGVSGNMRDASLFVLAHKCDVLVSVKTAFFLGGHLDADMSNGEAQFTMSIPLETEGEYAATEYLGGGLPMRGSWSYDELKVGTNKYIWNNFKADNKFDDRAQALRFPARIVVHTKSSPWHQAPNVWIADAAKRSNDSNKQDKKAHDRLRRLFLVAKCPTNKVLEEALRKQSNTVEALR